MGLTCMYKKVLIIGAETFLGFHLARRMENLGFLVITVIDNFTNVWRLRELSNSIEVVKIDSLLNHSILISTIKLINADYIFYMSNFLEKYLNPNRELIYQNELFFFHEFLNDMEDSFFETLIYVGVCPICNDSRMCYNKSNNKCAQNYNYKNCIPSIISELHASKNLPLFVVRPSIIYGEYFSTESFFGQFLINIIKNKQFYFDLTFIKKDFIHSRDFSNFLVNLMLAKPKSISLFDCSNGSTLEFSLFLKYFRSVFPGINLSRFNTSFFDKINKHLLPTRDSSLGCFAWNRIVPIDVGLIKTFRWSKQNINIYEITKSNKDFFTQTTSSIN